MHAVSHPHLKPGIALLQRFAQFDMKMQLSIALALLYIAQHQDRDEGVTTNDLTKWLGMAPAAASRNSYYWADGTPDMPHAGYGLIKIIVSPTDRRRRSMRLTPKGEAFVNQLEEILNA